MGIVLLWAVFAHEYIAIFIRIYGYRTSDRFKKAVGM